MSGYILDTSIVSLLAPHRHVLSAEVIERLRHEADRLFVPTIAVAEISEGICKLRRAGGAIRADAFDEWLSALLDRFGDRVVPFDVSAARAMGGIADTAKAAGKHPGFADVAIAAIASSRGLSVLTTNLRHFQSLGVPAFDPFVAMPERR